MKHRTKLRIWSLFNEADRSMLKTSAAPFNLNDLTEVKTQELIDQMIKTMYQANGIGLAAPQIGKSIRLAVVAGEIQGRKDPYILINPTIQVIGTEQDESEEGCLSIPGVFGNVTRSTRILVKAFGRHGQPWSEEADNLLARVIQHEVDHLNGVLFIDKATSFTKGQDKLP